MHKIFQNPTPPHLLASILGSHSLHSTLNSSDPFPSTSTCTLSTPVASNHSPHLRRLPSDLLQPLRHPSEIPAPPSNFPTPGNSHPPLHPICSHPSPSLYLHFPSPTPDHNPSPPPSLPQTLPPHFRPDHNPLSPLLPPKPCRTCEEWVCEGRTPIKGSTCVPPFLPAIPNEFKFPMKDPLGLHG